MSRFTAREKMQAAAREVNHRRWVYKRLVADGKKTQEASDLSIALMEEIHADYRALFEAEEAKGRLL